MWQPGGVQRNGLLLLIVSLLFLPLGAAEKNPFLSLITPNFDCWSILSSFFELTAQRPCRFDLTRTVILLVAPWISNYTLGQTEMDLLLRSPSRPGKDMYRCSGDIPIFLSFMTLHQLQQPLSHTNCSGVFFGLWCLALFTCILPSLGLASPLRLGKHRPRVRSV